MTLGDYVAAVKRGWWIIVATALVAVAGAVLTIVRHTDSYSSSTEIFVASSTAAKDSEDAYQRDLFATQRAASYVSVISGDVVADKVREKLGGSLNASIGVSQQPGTVVIKVTATSADPDDAAAAARAYADVVPGVIDEVERVDGEGPDVRVSTIDRAEVPSVPDAYPVLATLGAGLVLGLGLGTTIVLVREVLRRERAHGQSAPGGPGADPSPS